MTVDPALRAVMKSSIGAVLASFLLLSACADGGQQAPPRNAPDAGAPAETAGVPQPPAAAAASAEPTPQDRPDEPDHPAAQHRPIDPADHDRPLYLDVRTQAEYDAGHVAGTLHIPLDQLDQRWQELAPFRDRPIVVYCRTGRRSAAAMDLLRSRGFDRLENGGGVTHMAARGLPMEPQHCC